MERQIDTMKSRMRSHSTRASRRLTRLRFQRALFFVLGLVLASFLVSCHRLPPRLDSPLSGLDSNLTELILSETAPFDDSRQGEDSSGGAGITVSETVDAHSPGETLDDCFTVAAVGDVLIHQSLIHAAEREDGRYDFTSLFRHTKEMIARADISFFDMEGTFRGKPYSGYPAFSAPEDLAKQLREVGFDVAVTANNHALDYDIPGMKRTVEVLRSAGLFVMGTRLKAEEASFEIFEKKGIKLGVTAFTYESFRGGWDGQRRTLNGVPIPAEDEALIDSFSVETGSQALIERDQKRIQERIAKMRQAGAEAILVMMHWGTEYAPSEDCGQIVYAQTLADAGVDAVLACGPHVMQPVRDITSRDGAHEMLCFYSMGNFVSNQQFNTGNSEGKAEDGMIALISFARGADGRVAVARCGYVNCYVSKTYPKGRDLEYTDAVVLPVLEALASPERYGLTSPEAVTEVELSLQRARGVMEQNTPEKFNLEPFRDFFKP